MYVGVSVRDVETADVTREKLSGLSGAYLENVRPGGPAEKAGFKTGDVVTSFDGERVRSASQFLRLIDETPDAREVEVVVMRAGQQVTMKVAPEILPTVLGITEVNFVESTHSLAVVDAKLG